jgi:hypothetical protein
MNITCCCPDGQKQIDKCVLVNISKGGLAIESKSALPIGGRVMMMLNSPEGAKIPALVEILYSQEGNFATFYGAKYCDIDPSNLSVLNGYLLKYFNLY